MKIAVIGSGAREAVLAWKLRQNRDTEDVFVLPGNPGIPNSHPISALDFPAIGRFCAEHHVELIVVGPEKPLSEGIVDVFASSGIMILGPDREAAQLESSKTRAKEFMQKHGVATAPFRVCSSPCEAMAEITARRGNLVLKFDGLAAGKGVFVCSSVAEAKQALGHITATYGVNARIVAEERLCGEEVSVIGFTDGRDIRLMQPARDHKRLLDRDEGPNTGGMGAFCPVSLGNGSLMADIERQIVAPTLRGIQAERLNYRGPIYFGIMATPEGPKLLEYNVRLGDPETQVLLPSLETDLLDVILACLNGTLGRTRLAFHERSFVGVVLASQNYPASDAEPAEIFGLGDLREDTLVFPGAVRDVDRRLFTGGGRVLTLVRGDNDLEKARDAVYDECRKVRFQGMQFRRDIGKPDRHSRPIPEMDRQ